MYSEKGLDRCNLTEPPNPLDGAALEDHLKLVGGRIADQVSALLDEDEEAVAEVAKTDETITAGDTEQVERTELEVLEGRVVESRRRRIGKLGTAIAAIGRNEASIFRELASDLAAKGKPIARVAGELTVRAKGAANKIIDETDRREIARADKERAQRADIKRQVKLGGRGFCMDDLVYEQRTGNVSPRRVAPSPGIADDQEPQL